MLPSLLDFKELNTTTPIWQIASGDQFQVGDYNGDGYSDVIVGSQGYDNGQSTEGAAFVYHGSAAGINTIPAAMAEGNQVNATMGACVAGAGDVNGDGYSDAIVGAQQYDNGQTDEGDVNRTDHDPTVEFRAG